MQNNLQNSQDLVKYAYTLKISSIKKPKIIEYMGQTIL
jgi:hypothetical protein